MVSSMRTRPSSRRFCLPSRLSRIASVRQTRHSARPLVSVRSISRRLARHNFGGPIWTAPNESAQLPNELQEALSLCRLTAFAW